MSTWEQAGRRLMSSPSAVFVAVLTAGLATGSFARHAGFYPAPASSREASVVLACPRTKAPARSAKGDAKCPAASQKKTSSAAPAGRASASAAAENQTQAANTGAPAATPAAKSGAGLSVSLPDFSTPELSRFISPL